MAKERFNFKGMLKIPTLKKVTKEIIEEQVIIKECYCVNGHNLISDEYSLSGHPGIKLEFNCDGSEGKVILSAVIGNYEKNVLSGNWTKGKKVDMCCPECKAQLPVLTSCDCNSEAEFVALGLTPKIDFNNSIALCNIIGCKDSYSMVKSEKIINKTLAR